MSEEEREVSEQLDSFGTEMGRESRTNAVEWLFADGDRLYVATLITAVVFCLLLVLGEIGVIAFENDDSITRLAGGMIAGSFSLVTLVVSINQLILSREFAAADEFRDRLSGVMEFRRDVEELGDVPASPAEPGTLLDMIVTATGDRAARLERAAEREPGDRRDAIVKYASSVRESSEMAREDLEGAEFGSFRVLSVAIDYDDAWQIYAGRHVANSYRGELHGETVKAFDDLLEALRQFNVARSHFKTTYLQREVTRFSQLTILCGVPAVLGAVVLGLSYADVTGATIDPQYLPFTTSALIALVFSPLALLASYILRTATVARRTASIGPMIPQMGADEGQFDIEYDEGG
jgi:hypothetical protein